MHEIKRVHPQNLVFGESGDILESGVGKHNPILLEYEQTRQGAPDDGPKELILIVRVKDDGIQVFDGVSIMHLFSKNPESVWAYLLPQLDLKISSYRIYR